MEHTGKQPASPAPDTALGGEWPAEQRPLQECGEIASLRLSSALADTLQLAAEQLLVLGAQAPGSHERDIFMEAADFAKMRRQMLADDFRQHFEQRYASACRRRKSNLISGHVIDFDVSHLRIVAHDQLEDVIDPAEITEAIRNGTWSPLYELTKWFREALAQSDTKPDDIPLGPKPIADAVCAAIKVHYRRHEVNHRLIRALCRLLPGRVNQVYLDLVGHLLPQLPAAFPTGLPGADHAVGLEDGLRGDPSADLASAVGPAAGGDGAAAAAALEAAQQAVSRCLSGVEDLPEVIGEFLCGQWQTHLGRLHFEHGVDSHAWKHAVKTMEDLVWSLHAKRTAAESTRLVKDLPSLVKRLSEGLEALGEPLEAQDRFFISLAKCHVKVLTESRSADGRAAAAPPPAAAGGPQAGAAAGAAAASQLDGLEVGAWLEFLEPDGGRRALRLGRVSPHRNVYIFTDQQGERALALRAQNLLTLLGNGQARRIPTPGSRTSVDSSEANARYKRTA
jgi:hypothetical protein